MMTIPDGFVIAERVTGVVKVADRLLPEGGYIPGSIVGPGDTAIISEGEAKDSDFWKPVPEPKAKNKKDDD